MVLNVAHAVRNELRDADVEPFEIAAPKSLLVRQSVDRRSALRAAMEEIGAQLVLRIRPLGKQPRRIELVQSERRRRRESLDRLGKVEVEIEERVEDQVPEFGLPRPVAP